MKLFHSVVGALSNVFGFQPQTKGAEETRGLKKYRNDVGRPFGFASAMQPLLPVAASLLWKPQVSIGEERTRPSHLLIEYFTACLETTPSRKRDDERKKVEQAARKATEHARQAELAERAQWAEKAKHAELARKVEAAKQSELARRAREEARRQAEDAMRAEEARRAVEERKAAEEERVWLRLCEEFRNGNPRASDSEWETEEECEDDGAWGGLGEINWWDWGTCVDDGYGTDPENEFDFDDLIYTADDEDDDGFFSR